jgi:hypothetical protein
MTKLHHSSGAPDTKLPTPGQQPLHERTVSP